MSDNTNFLRKTITPLLGFKYFILIASIIFFIIISIALFLVYQNASIMRDRINDDFNKQQLMLANQVSSQIDSDLRAIGKELEILSTNINTIITESNTPLSIQAFYERTYQKGMIAFGVINSDNELISFFDPQNKTVSEIKNDFNFNDMKSYGDLILSPLKVVAAEEDTIAIFGLITKTVESEKEKSRIIFSVIDVSILVRRVAEKIRSGETGYAWVVDNTELFLYHPDYEFIGKNAFTARKEREPYISFNEINQIMKNEMLKGQEGTGVYKSGWHRGVKGEMDKLIAYSPVKCYMLKPPNVWSVAVAAPTTEVSKVVHGIYMRHIAVEGAIIASMFIFGIFIMIYQFRISEALKEKVSEKEKYISSILGNSLDAIIFIDQNNRVKVWNKGAEKIFGYTANEMLGNTFHSIIPPDMDPDEELNNITDEVNKKGYIRHYVAKRITKDGKRITIDLSRTLIKNEEGEILGSTAIIKDVTDKMEFESRIYNTEKLASIGNLAAGVAHEINNPLAVILGFTDLLKEKFEKGSAEYDDLNTIEENANNAKKIVEDLLGFARVTEGMEDIVDINQSIYTVSNIVKNTLLTTKIGLVVNISDNLPEVKGDSREFQQVIFNLINNSIAAMESDGGTLTISSREDNGWVRIDIEDTGKGIPIKFRQRIFDPFFTTKEVGKGTGLGLSLCYGIVSKYGGKMNFTSISKEDEPHKQSGTVFTVLFPAYQKNNTGGKI